MFGIVGWANCTSVVSARKLKVLPPWKLLNITNLFICCDLFESHRLSRRRTANNVPELMIDRENRKPPTMVLSQNDAGKSLTTAAAKGDTSEVRRMLEECRVHADTVNEFGKTALQVMMMGNSNVATLLLENGADPNVQDRRGVAPAHDAARTGFLDTLQVLVEFGASVNTPDQSGALPIHAAVREGFRDVVEFLAPRSDLKHRNASGHTAVDVAREACTPDVVELLERQLDSCVFQAHSAPTPL